MLGYVKLMSSLSIQERSEDKCQEIIMQILKELF